MALWRFLTSLKTCAWAGLVFSVAGAVGSVVMGRYPELFADMDARVFAGWFARKGFADPAPTLWLYGLLMGTGLLAVNAACCTFERLVQIFRGTVTLRRLLPHVMHIAFLGVVLSHLVSAVYGDRIPGVAIPQGGFAIVGGTSWAMRLDRFEFIGTIAWYFLLLNCFKVPFFVGLNMITPESLFFDLKLAPVILLGAAAGILAPKWIPEKPFRYVVMALAAAAAFKLLAFP